MFLLKSFIRSFKQVLSPVYMMQSPNPARNTPDWEDRGDTPPSRAYPNPDKLVRDNPSPLGMENKPRGSHNLTRVEADQSHNFKTCMYIT